MRRINSASCGLGMTCLSPSEMTTGCDCFGRVTVGRRLAVNAPRRLIVTDSRRGASNAPSGFQPSALSRDNPGEAKPMATRISQPQTTDLPTGTRTGAETDTATAAAREVVSYNPATGEEVGRVPLGSEDDVRGAVARARAAQKRVARALLPRARRGGDARARPRARGDGRDRCARLARDGEARG